MFQLSPQEQSFSNSSMQKNHPEGFSEDFWTLPLHILPSPQISDWKDLGLDLIICISDKFHGLDHTLRNTVLQEHLLDGMQHMVSAHGLIFYSPIKK